ncbi:hypothetical protein IU450_34360 [Nocardia abscessus]|uniref:hypothetical protein n=1 Tax=Nocardia abscessus TaxID=120957 RepID=UPI0018942A8F|nr:hypothetical protein [Nocardia abscessus]MBF6340937.1 hypothetical protein [Nocardia abscessus]
MSTATAPVAIEVSAASTAPTGAPVSAGACRASISSECLLQGGGESLLHRGMAQARSAGLRGLTAYIGGVGMRPSFARRSSAHPAPRTGPAEIRRTDRR